jgi:hydroxyethylthiazole kinase-like uncharacterized protein yjeF
MLPFLNASASRVAASQPSGGFFGAEHVPLLTALEMRAWDDHATGVLAIPDRVLMEAAGRAAAGVVQRLYPQGRVVAAVGAGNNGGDALVLLRALHGWGRDVCAIPLADRALRPELLHGWDIPIGEASEAPALLASAGVIVDGMLGTGARGAPRETAARLIEMINDAAAPVAALDGPSGVDLTDGSTPGAAVQADVTIAFGAPKRGLLLFPGRRCAGRIIAVEIGLPPLASVAARVVTPSWAHARLPAVPANAHKGTLGTVTVVAGHPGMAGAAILVGMGAARAGAGKVRFVSPRENRVILQTAVPEALFVDRDNEKLEGAFHDADAVVAGPGMGTDDSAGDALRILIERGEAPLLLDADALNLIAQDHQLLEKAGDRPRLLTPHPGEMARLMGTETGQVVADPFGAVTQAAERFGCAVLLKGMPSLVAAPGETILANVAGHSGIATGGMGDTLAGIAGAFLAQGCSPGDAAALALFFSGRAAQLAGGGRSLLPRDVAEALPAALLEPGGHPALDIAEVCFDLPAAY